MDRSRTGRVGAWPALVFLPTAVVAIVAVHAWPGRPGSGVGLGQFQLRLGSGRGRPGAVFHGSAGTELYILLSGTDRACRMKLPLLKSLPDHPVTCWIAISDGPYRANGGLVREDPCEVADSPGPRSMGREGLAGLAEGTRARGDSREDGARVPHHRARASHRSMIRARLAALTFGRLRRVHDAIEWSVSSTFEGIAEGGFSEFLPQGTHVAILHA